MKDGRYEGQVFPSSQAIPYLVRDLRKKDNWHAARWIWLYGKLPQSLQRRFRTPVPPHELRYHSARGLELLGDTAAEDAVPALLEAWKSSGGPMLRDYAMDALKKISPKTAANPWR
jgi:HEAT repeat protein